MLNKTEVVVGGRSIELQLLDRLHQACFGFNNPKYLFTSFSIIFHLKSYTKVPYFSILWMFNLKNNKIK